MSKTSAMKIQSFIYIRQAYPFEKKTLNIITIASSMMMKNKYLI